jgi:hypothetical protein
VAALADGHPLQGLRAHAAASGWLAGSGGAVVGDVDDDGVASFVGVGLGHDR